MLDKLKIIKGVLSQILYFLSLYTPKITSLEQNKNIEYFASLISDKNLEYLESFYASKIHGPFIDVKGVFNSISVSSDLPQDIVGFVADIKRNVDELLFFKKKIFSASPLTAKREIIHLKFTLMYLISVIEKLELLAKRSTDISSAFDQLISKSIPASKDQINPKLKTFIDFVNRYSDLLDNVNLQKKLFDFLRAFVLKVSGFYPSEAVFPLKKHLQWIEDLKVFFEHNTRENKKISLNNFINTLVHDLKPAETVSSNLSQIQSELSEFPDFKNKTAVFTKLHNLAELFNSQPEVLGEDSVRALLKKYFDNFISGLLKKYGDEKLFSGKIQSDWGHDFASIERKDYNVVGKKDILVNFISNILKPAIERAEYWQAERQNAEKEKEGLLSFLSQPLKEFKSIDQINSFVSSLGPFFASYPTGLKFASVKSSLYKFFVNLTNNIFAFYHTDESIFHVKDVYLGLETVSKDVASKDVKTVVDNFLKFLSANVQLAQRNLVNTAEKVSKIEKFKPTIINYLMKPLPNKFESEKEIQQLLSVSSHLFDRPEEALTLEDGFVVICVLKFFENFTNRVFTFFNHNSDVYHHTTVLDAISDLETALKSKDLDVKKLGFKKFTDVLSRELTQAIAESKRLKGENEKSVILNLLDKALPKFSSQGQIKEFLFNLDAVFKKYPAAFADKSVQLVIYKFFVKLNNAVFDYYEQISPDVFDMVNVGNLLQTVKKDMDRGDFGSGAVDLITFLLKEVERAEGKLLKQSQEKSAEKLKFEKDKKAFLDYTWKSADFSDLKSGFKVLNDFLNVCSNYSYLFKIKESSAVSSLNNFFKSFIAKASNIFDDKKLFDRDAWEREATKCISKVDKDGISALRDFIKDLSAAMEQAAKKKVELEKLAKEEAEKKKKAEEEERKKKAEEEEKKKKAEEEEKKRLEFEKEKSIVSDLLKEPIGKFRNRRDISNFLIGLKTFFKKHAAVFSDKSIQLKTFDYFFNLTKNIVAFYTARFANFQETVEAHDLLVNLTKAKNAVKSGNFSLDNVLVLIKYLFDVIGRADAVITLEGKKKENLARQHERDVSAVESALKKLPREFTGRASANVLVDLLHIFNKYQSTFASKDVRNALDAYLLAFINEAFAFFNKDKQLFNRESVVKELDQCVSKLDQSGLAGLSAFVKDVLLQELNNAFKLKALREKQEKERLEQQRLLVETKKRQELERLRQERLAKEQAQRKAELAVERFGTKLTKKSSKAAQVFEDILDKFDRMDVDYPQLPTERQIQMGKATPALIGSIKEVIKRKDQTNVTRLRSIKEQFRIFVKSTKERLGKLSLPRNERKNIDDVLNAFSLYVRDVEDVLFKDKFKKLDVTEKIATINKLRARFKTEILPLWRKNLLVKLREYTPVLQKFLTS